ncbi:hypothetical protein GCK72_010915 [Caenorhabditis remanei]|uniref:Uncharacterized protein n=1 Tax=Caenorhabditis remanei TaxID=31234 RepID=A0A6A5H818_CAERE|nr:hypothetical protein GCK72_010915 [Caenorhabditis remanei]KAF1762653.1 hypothetical protein GCK72_010915 [Caenorhabditis remanei]
MKLSKLIKLDCCPLQDTCTPPRKSSSRIFMDSSSLPQASPGSSWTPPGWLLLQDSLGILSSRILVDSTRLAPSPEYSATLSSRILVDSPKLPQAGSSSRIVSDSLLQLSRGLILISLAPVLLLLRLWTPRGLTWGSSRLPPGLFRTPTPRGLIADSSSFPGLIADSSSDSGLLGLLLKFWAADNQDLLA